MQRKGTALYFKHVIAISAERILLAGHLYLEETDPSISRILMLDQGAWYHLYDLPDITRDTLLLPPAANREKEVYCFLGRRGLLREHPSGQSPRDEQLPLANAYIKCLREIDGQLYACGTQGQVLRRTEQGWIRMDQGVYEPLTGQVTSSLNALDGCAADDIYAAGDGGALWHWDGRHWSRLDSPSNLPLYAVLRHSDGSIVLAGAGGLVFKGNHQQGWTDLSDPSFDELTLQQACEFDGALYFCAGSALLSYAKGILSRVQIPLPGPLAFDNLDARAGTLWVVGDDSVLSFDGTQWRRHPCPEN